MGPKKNNRNKNKNNNNNNSSNNKNQNSSNGKEENVPVLTTVSVESSNEVSEINNSSIDSSISNSSSNIIVEQTTVIQAPTNEVSTTTNVIIENKNEQPPPPVEPLVEKEEKLITKEELESSLSKSMELEQQQQQQQQQHNNNKNQHQHHNSHNHNQHHNSHKEQQQPVKLESNLKSVSKNKLITNITDAFSRAAELEEEPISPKTNEEWKQLYFLISKQLNLERIKCETLEGLVIQKDKENQLLSEQVTKLENELLSERRRINRTIGTTKLQTRKLLSTVKFDHNIDIASIIDDLNNIDSSISASPSFADDLTSASISNSASNSFSEFNSDQLLNKLNNYHHSTSSLINAPLSGSSSSGGKDSQQQQQQQLSTSSERQSNLTTSNSSNTSIGGGNGSIRLSASNNSLNSLTSSSSASLRANLSSLACASYSSKEDIEKITLVQSLVRKWLARKRYKKLRTKRAVVEELFETESTYVSHLSNLIKIFVQPLKAKKGDSILPSDEFDSIFSNIASIYKTNSFFLDQVDEIFKKFNKWSCFGEKLLKLVPLFECYVDYIINYEYAQKNLKKAISSFSSFANFVKQGNSRKELDDLDLEDLLIMPVQRIPRYIMLLKEIRKFTPLYHNDFNGIDKALEAFKQFAANVNKKSGARKMVLQLEDRLLNYKDDITTHSRILVSEGVIKYKKNQEYILLFNDMIIICHPTHSKKVKKSSLLSSSSSSSTANGADKDKLDSSSGSGSNGNSKSPTPSSPVLRDHNNSYHQHQHHLNNNNLLDTSFSSIMSNNSNNSHHHHQAVHEFHSSNLDINYKFLARYTLDARVKIIQDLTDPKFTVLIPDVYSIDLFAPSMEERQHWVQEINKVVSTFANNILPPTQQSQDS